MDTVLEASALDGPMVEVSVHVVIMSEDFPPCTGGIAQWAYGVARSLCEMGHSVTVYTKAKSLAGSHMHDSEPYSTIRMGGHNWKNFRSVYSLYYNLRILLRCDVDLFILTTWNIAMVATSLSHRLGVRTAVVTHGLEVTRRNVKGIRARRLRYVLSHATLPIAVSRFTRQRITEKTGLEERVISVIPVAVDVRRFHPSDDGGDLRGRLGLQGRKVILTLARVVERKGHDTVIRAMPLVAKAHPDAVYVIAGRGHGEVLARLRQMVDEFGLGGSVIFTGYVEDKDLINYYNLCDVYIMVSRELVGRGDTEGFGITFLEANACGKPVIGGDSCGIPDAIEDGRTGYLVDPENAEEVAARINALLDDPVLARRMGAAGLERVYRGFTWRGVTEMILREVGARAGRERGERT